MKRFIVSIFLLLMLTACGQKDPDLPVLLGPDAEVTASPRTANRVGREAYEEYCAECHEEGLDGAPRTGDRDAWDGRSQLWEAVLFEHARGGYEDMPAKGGEATLDEATVTKAAEYMMTLTFRQP